MELFTAVKILCWSELLIHDLRKLCNCSTVRSWDTLLCQFKCILSLRSASLLARWTILNERWLLSGFFNDKPSCIMPWDLNLARKVMWLMDLANWILLLGLSKGLQQYRCLLLLPEDGNRYIFRNVLLSSYLEFRTMDIVHKPSDSECDTPPSGFFRFYKETFCFLARDSLLSNKYTNFSHETPVVTFKTLAPFYRTVQRHISEGICIQTVIWLLVYFIHLHAALFVFLPFFITNV
jgi:hypothetical protein